MCESDTVDSFLIRDETASNFFAAVWTDCVYVFFTVSFSGSLFVPSSLTFCMFG